MDTFSARIGGVLRSPESFLAPELVWACGERPTGTPELVLDLLMQAKRGCEAPDPNPLFDQR